MRVVKRGALGRGRWWWREQSQRGTDVHCQRALDERGCSSRIRTRGEAHTQRWYYYYDNSLGIIHLRENVMLALRRRSFRILSSVLTGSPDKRCRVEEIPAEREVQNVAENVNVYLETTNM